MLCTIALASLQEGERLAIVDRRLVDVTRRAEECRRDTHGKARHLGLGEEIH